MLKVALFVLLSGGIIPVAAQAQSTSQGPGGLANPYANLAGSGMEAHDTVTAPGQRELLDKALLNNNIDQIEAHQRAKLGPARPAKASEITVGARVNDKDGAAIARVDEVATDGVVVSSGTAKVKVPVDAFGHNKAGLLLDMTKTQFQQVVAQANTHP
jgi:hypothetical protein